MIHQGLGLVGRHTITPSLERVVYVRGRQPQTKHSQGREKSHGAKVGLRTNGCVQWDAEARGGGAEERQHEVDPCEKASHASWHVRTNCSKHDRVVVQVGDADGNDCGGCRNRVHFACGRHCGREHKCSIGNRQPKEAYKELRVKPHATQASVKLGYDHSDNDGAQCEQAEKQRGGYNERAHRAHPLLDENHVGSSVELEELQEVHDGDGAEEAIPTSSGLLLWVHCVLAGRSNVKI
mmetsp:Transcript_74430/g.206704  ORF Transcript_74430/g.206704 Transcript_74430/m.206704 type:complete len:237 (-) Transcript_74430:657-1367(-)